MSASFILWRAERGAHVGERDLLAHVRMPPLRPATSTSMPRVKNGLTFSMPSFASPYGVPISAS